MQRLEEVLVIWLAGAHRHEKYIFKGQPLDNLGSKIKSLLRGKAGDDAEHRSIVFYVRSAKGMQQITLAVGFAAQIFHGIMRGDSAVRFWIPLGVIHPVQNAV